MLGTYFRVTGWKNPIHDQHQQQSKPYGTVSRECTSTTSFAESDFVVEEKNISKSLTSLDDAC